MQFPGETERGNRQTREIFDMVSDSLSQRYTQPLDIEIRLQTSSKEDIDRERQNILYALAQQKPMNWDLTFNDQEAIAYFGSNPQFLALVGQTPNSDRHPLTWILDDLIQRGYLSSIYDFKLDFYTPHDLPTPNDNYLGLFCPAINSDSQVDDNDFMVYRGELTEELVERGFEESTAVLYTNIFDASVAVPILQHAFGAIEDETGLAVICYLPSDHDTETPRKGVIYSPSEFSSLEYKQIISLAEKIRRRGPDLRSVE